MELFFLLLTLLGLALFEIVSSIDNAVINADVLSTMSGRARKWFLVWGLLFAVFVVRGVLPWLIVWVANPALGPVQALTATFSSDPLVVASIEASKPVLLIGGGVFLLFLFLHWLFMEPKNFGLQGEETIQKFSLWFFAVVSILLALIVWFAIRQEPLMAFGAVVGSTAFFITHGFKENAESQGRLLLGENSRNLTDFSKILYLEIIDATFSIDGVIGAFAFTLSVPLIILGNGLGAFIVREFTLHHIPTVKKYRYLKNGAMYSVGLLGIVMLADSFGFDIPSFVSPLLTFAVIGYFFWKSHKEIVKSSAAVN
ncbi:MAG: DUF475 domain-containing protein [Candidatus Diapherotrites archaeon]|nr:DUF475 domain-containing protein [Candidatus Diapherotrites archaeon]